MLRSENSVLIDQALDYARKNLNEPRISVGDVALPEKMTIRPLTAADTTCIRQWAGTRKGGFIQHMLHLEQSENDKNTLEYGVFTDHLLAVAACAPERVHGFALNDCIMIMFAEGEEEPKLYRPIYTYVMERVAERGLIPFDNLQQGEYAKENGDFTSADLGYTLVNKVYCLGNQGNAD